SLHTPSRACSSWLLPPPHPRRPTFGRDRTVPVPGLFQTLPRASSPAPVAGHRSAEKRANLKHLPPPPPAFDQGCDNPSQGAYFLLRRSHSQEHRADALHHGGALFGRAEITQPIELRLHVPE